MRKVFHRLGYLSTQFPVGGTVWERGTDLLEDVRH